METALAAAFDRQNRAAFDDFDTDMLGAWGCKVMHSLVAIELASVESGTRTENYPAHVMGDVRTLASHYRSLFSAYLNKEVPQFALSHLAFNTQFDIAENDRTAFFSDELFGVPLVQVHGLAVFISVDDGGFCSELDDPYLSIAKHLELNPIQLTEVYCRLIDHLNSRWSTRRLVQSSRSSSFHLSGVNSPGAPVDGFLSGLLRERLAPLGYSPEDVSDPAQTWLFDQDGHPRFLSLSATRGRSPTAQTSHADDESDGPP